MAVICKNSSAVCSLFCHYICDSVFSRTGQFQPRVRPFTSPQLLIPPEGLPSIACLRVQYTVPASQPLIHS